MSIELKLKRGNNNTTQDILGTNGELYVNTDNNSIHQLDGNTKGGTFVPPMLSAKNAQNEKVTSNRMLFVKDGIIVNDKGDPVRSMCFTLIHSITQYMIFNLDGQDIWVNPDTSPYDYWHMFRWPSMRDTPYTQQTFLDKMYEEFKIYSSYGFNYIRTHGPCYSVAWYRDFYETYGLDEFVRRYRLMLDAIAASDLGSVVQLSQDFPATMEYFKDPSEDYNALYDENSKTSQNIKAYYASLVSGLADHPGIAAWSIDGEQNIHSDAGDVVDTDPNNGAVFNTPKAIALLKMIGNTVRENDPYGRMISSGHTASEIKGDADAWIAHTLSINPDPLDCVCIHPYFENISRSGAALTDIYRKLREAATAAGKAVYFGETGAQVYAQWGGTSVLWPEADQAKIYADAIYRSGVQLCTWYEWLRNANPIEGRVGESATSGFGILTVGAVHPDNKENDGHKVFEVVKHYNNLMKNTGHIHEETIEKRLMSSKFRDSANITGDGSSYVNADAPAMLSIDNTELSQSGVSVAFWMKLNDDIDTTRRHFIMGQEDESTQSGWFIELTAEQQIRFLVRTKDSNNNNVFPNGVGGNLSASKGWVHVLVQYDNNDVRPTSYDWSRDGFMPWGSHGFNIFINGLRAWGVRSIPDLTYTHANVPLRLLARGKFNVDFAQVGLGNINFFNRSLSDREIFDLYCYNKLPVASTITTISAANNQVTDSAGLMTFTPSGSGVTFSNDIDYTGDIFK